MRPLLLLLLLRHHICMRTLMRVWFIRIVKFELLVRGRPFSIRKCPVARTLTARTHTRTHARARARVQTFTYEQYNVSVLARTHTRTCMQTHTSTTNATMRQVFHCNFLRNFLLDEHLQMIINARQFLFLEHQYPFQNFALTYCMTQTLQKNPNLYVFNPIELSIRMNARVHVCAPLRVCLNSSFLGIFLFTLFLCRMLLIILPVKTDLPGGFIGEFIDWSQDHSKQPFAI